MEDCIALARTLGERVGRELEIPVFLYERAATRPDRENLADVRRGEFEGLRDEIGTNAAAHAGLRPVARAPDRRRRRHRRAPVPRRVQRLPRPRVEHAGREGCREGRARLVGRPALREGTRLRGGRPGAGLDEPRRHREDAAAPRVRHGEDGSRGARRDADVERDRRPRARARAVRRRGAARPAARTSRPTWCSSARCAQPSRAARSLSGFVGSVASPTPAPGGGSVAAHAGALGAALAQMVAGLTSARRSTRPSTPRCASSPCAPRRSATRSARSSRAMRGLCDRGGRVQAARGHARSSRRAKTARSTSALLHAAAGARSRRRARAPRCAQLAIAVAERGNTNAASGRRRRGAAGRGGCRGAAYNVRSTSPRLSDP